MFVITTTVTTIITIPSWAFESTNVLPQPAMTELKSIKEKCNFLHMWKMPQEPL